MSEVGFVLFGLFLVDFFLTYLNVGLFRRVFPDKDFVVLEMNPLVRFFWKKLGLKWGGVVSFVVQSLILCWVVLFFSRDTQLVLSGMFLMTVLVHGDNLQSLLSKKSFNWRKWAVILLIGLSFIDFCLTGVYLGMYHGWRPDVPFNEMESNVLIVPLVNFFGIVPGLVASAVILWSLFWVVGKKCHWLIIVGLIGVIASAIVINSIHLSRLIDLIRLYQGGVVT